jgi:hypothetical protein
VTKTSSLGRWLGATALAATVALGCSVALAQEKQDKKAPAAKTETKTKPETKKTPDTPSACKGLDETACKGKAAECSWIAATKTKAGKDRKAYCRSKPKPKTKT